MFKFETKVKKDLRNCNKANNSQKYKLKHEWGQNLYRLTGNKKSENIGIDIKGLVTRKSPKIPSIGQPVDK